MTKSRHKGENEFVRELRRRAKRAGEDVCTILRKMRREAGQRGDTEAERKIVEAEKYLGCRNRKKRGKR
jgi:hypothetical protein